VTKSGRSQNAPSSGAPLRVLMVASEAAPYANTGGLGDVVGALPLALARRGLDVLTVAPLYPSVLTAGALENSGRLLEVTFPDGVERAGLVEAERNGKGPRFAFLDHPGFFARSGLYGDANGDFPDNAKRFGFLCAAAVEAAVALKFTPDVVHCHDWHAGLGAHFAKRRFPKARCVFTVHNMAYQGNFPLAVSESLGLAREQSAPEEIEQHDPFSFLKTGLLDADAITTVSPRYAREIQTPEFGFGLEDVIRERSDRVSGILNGIDADAFDPRSDESLPRQFSERNLDGKVACRKELLKTFGVPALADDVPLFGMVTRLTDQKGIDLVLEALPRLLQPNGAAIILGDGESVYEEALRRARVRYPRRFGVKIGFDRRLARLVFAGCDLYLMPSRFEPCGLSQMYAMRYGSVPVVRAVGGLDDTVIDVSADKKRGTGFKFEPYRTEALLNAADRAVQARADAKSFAEIIRRCLKMDFSWSKSGAAYETVYRSR
jgi:starch synthase